ncbi:MAG: hypothetical protein SFU87_16025 [Chitinophagaceae bacterium]|jgi:hypothetical protein|nr:hypothetical protein [Chitinophagaceae bacterium]
MWAILVGMLAGLIIDAVRAERKMKKIYNTLREKPVADPASSEMRPIDWNSFYRMPE